MEQLSVGGVVLGDFDIPPFSCQVKMRLGGECRIRCLALGLNAGHERQITSSFQHLDVMGWPRSEVSLIISLLSNSEAEIRQMSVILSGNSGCLCHLISAQVHIGRVKELIFTLPQPRFFHLLMSFCLFFFFFSLFLFFLRMFI